MTGRFLGHSAVEMLECSDQGFWTSCLVLLCHKTGPASSDFRFRRQHGHRSKRLARTTVRRFFIVTTEFGKCRSGRTGAACLSATAGNRRFFALRGATRSRGGIRLPPGDQKPAGCDAERGVMVETAPAAPFEMAEADFLLEVLIVALDAPAQLGRIDQIGEGNVFRQGRQPGFGRSRVALGPFDRQPFLRSQLRELFVAVCRPHPHPRKTRRQPIGRTLAPGDCLPCRFRQTGGERPRPDQAFAASAPRLAARHSRAAGVRRNPSGPAP